MSIERTIEAYSIHGHVSGGVLDYEEFFAGISRLSALERYTTFRGQVVGINEHLSLDDGRVQLKFFIGREGVPPTLLDLSTGRETVDDIGQRVVATMAWVVVDATKRVAAVEMRRPGVPIIAMEAALEHFVRALGIDEHPFISLNAILAPSFVTEVEKLDRIRQAAVVLQRPNFDWDDNASDLTGYAETSNADRAEIELSAGRNKSLAKDNGIMADIVAFAKKPIGALRDVRVTGQRWDELKERTIRMTRYKEREFVQLEDGEADPAQIADGAARLIDRLPIEVASTESDG